MAGEDRILLNHDQGLGNGKKTNQGWNKRHPVEQLKETEGGPRRRVDVVRTDGAEHQAEEAGDQPLQCILRRNHGDKGKAEQHDDDHIHAMQQQANPGQRRKREKGYHGSDQPPNGGGNEAHHQGLLRPPLDGHGMAVQRGGGGAAGSGDFHQNRRNAAAQVRGRIKRNHENQRQLDVNRQRERQQDDNSVVRPEPGDGPHENTEKDRRNDNPPVTEGGQEKFEQNIAAKNHLRTSPPADSPLDRAEAWNPAGE